MVSVLSRGVSRNVAVTRAACTSHRSVAKAADTGVVTACSAAARLRRAGCSSSSVRLTSQRPSGLAANMSSKGRSLHASSTCGSRSAARDAAAGVATPCSPAARLRRAGRSSSCYSSDQPAAQRSSGQCVQRGASTPCVSRLRQPICRERAGVATPFSVAARFPSNCIR